DGAIVDSTDIVRWADRHGDAAPLFDDRVPEIAELEARFDQVLGPHSRRLAYGHLLPHMKQLLAAARGVPRAQLAVAKATARRLDAPVAWHGAERAGALAQEGRHDLRGGRGAPRRRPRVPVRRSLPRRGPHLRGARDAGARAARARRLPAAGQLAGADARRR